MLLLLLIYNKTYNIMFDDMLPEVSGGCVCCKLYVYSNILLKLS